MFHENSSVMGRAGKVREDLGGTLCYIHGCPDVVTEETGNFNRLDSCR